MFRLLSSAIVLFIFIHIKELNSFRLFGQTKRPIEPKETVDYFEISDELLKRYGGRINNGTEVEAANYVEDDVDPEEAAMLNGKCEGAQFLRATPQVPRGLMQYCSNLDEPITFRNTPTPRRYFGKGILPPRGGLMRAEMKKNRMLIPNRPKNTPACGTDLIDLLRIANNGLQSQHAAIWTQPKGNKVKSTLQIKDQPLVKELVDDLIAIGKSKDFPVYLGDKGRVRILNTDLIKQAQNILGSSQSHDHLFLQPHSCSMR